MRQGRNRPWLELVIVFWLVLIWSWESLYLLLTVDDSFYYLQIARNAVAGTGVSFDGVVATNGFHPLWLAALTALVKWAPQDPGHLTRFVLSVQTVLVYLAVRLLVRALPGRGRQMTAAAALLLVNFYFAKVLINGMESGLLALLIAVTLAFWSTPLGATSASGVRAGAIGLLTAAVTLTRLEAALFAIPILWSPESPRFSNQRNPWRSRTIAAACYALPIGLYLAVNFTQFGHLLPVSAAVKAERAWWSWQNPGVRMAMALVVLWVGYIVSAWRFGPREPRLRLLIPIATFALLGSALHLPAGLAGIWYLVPHALGVLIVAAYLSGASQRLGRATVLSCAAAWLVFSAATWKARLDPSSYTPVIAARDNGRWLAENTRADATVAGWACGNAAVHSNRRFYNLDGLANSWEYKTEYLDRARTAQFLDREGVDYVAQYFDLRWPSPIYNHVDLADWRVARAECVEFRSIVRRSRTRRLLYTVLSRRADETLPRFGDFLPEAEAICP